MKNSKHAVIGSAQIPGTAKEDVHVFKHLWDTTVGLLEGVLAVGKLKICLGSVIGAVCHPFEAVY